MFNVLRTAFGARRNPLLMVLTTAGRDVTGIAYETRARVIKVLEGVLEDDRLCGAVFTLDAGRRVGRRAVGRRRTPCWTTRRRPAASCDSWRSKRSTTPCQELSFRQFYANEWLQISASAWLNVEDIRRCADPRLRLDDFAGARVWIGFDSALKDDSASVAVMTLKDGILYMFAKSFLPADVGRAIREADPGVSAMGARRTAGTDRGRDRRPRADPRLHRGLHERFKVQAVVIEQFAAGNLPSDLLRMGIKVEVSPKNARMFTPPSLDLEARIRNRLFRFDGNSHATWMLSNACVERRVNGSLLPKKEHEKSAAKIDIVDACLLEHDSDAGRSRPGRDRAEHYVHRIAAKGSPNQPHRSLTVAGREIGQYTVRGLSYGDSEVHRRHGQGHHRAGAIDQRSPRIGARSATTSSRRSRRRSSCAARQAQTVLDAATQAGRDSLLASEQRSYDGAIRERDAILGAAAGTSSGGPSSGRTCRRRRSSRRRGRRTIVARADARAALCRLAAAARRHAYAGEAGADTMRFGAIVRALATRRSARPDGSRAAGAGEGTDAAGGFTRAGDPRRASSSIASGTRWSSAGRRDTVADDVATRCTWRGSRSRAFTSARRRRLRRRSGKSRTTDHRRRSDAGARHVHGADVAAPAQAVASSCREDSREHRRDHRAGDGRRRWRWSSTASALLGSGTRAGTARAS